MRWDYPPLDINPVFPGLGEFIIIIFIVIIIIIIIITIIIIIIVIIIMIRVMCVSGHFCNTRLFSNPSFSVLCSENFEVMKLAVTRYDETNVDIHPFLILNLEKPKILNDILFDDNKNSLYKLFLQTIITWVNQFINYIFNQFYIKY